MFSCIDWVTSSTFCCSDSFSQIFHEELPLFNLFCGKDTSTFNSKHERQWYSRPIYVYFDFTVLYIQYLCALNQWAFTKFWHYCIFWISYAVGQFYTQCKNIFLICQGYRLHFEILSTLPCLWNKQQTVYCNIITNSNIKLLSKYQYWYNTRTAYCRPYVWLEGEELILYRKTKFYFALLFMADSYPKTLLLTMISLLFITINLLFQSPFI